MDAVTAAAIIGACVVVLILGASALVLALHAFEAVVGCVAHYLEHRFPAEPAKPELARLEALIEQRALELTKDVEKIREQANKTAVAVAMKSSGR